MNGTIQASRHAIKALPKVELHAHLHGSIKQQTLQRLLAERRPSDDRLADVSFDLFHIDSIRDLDKCFVYFELVYLLVEDEQTVQQITQEVLRDFYEDGVRYLELRTTPKANERTGLTKDSYLQTLERAIEWAKEALPDMQVYLLLSVNRARLTSAEDARKDVDELLDLAIKHRSLVVGVDICGNPAKGDLSLVLPLLRSRLYDDARYHHLKLTVHTAEMANTDTENAAILELNPQRLGHVCFLSDAHSELVAREGRAIELCPTSNKVAMDLTTMEDHHFGYYYKERRHPAISICTDDTGLFSTTLTDELQHLAQAFDLTLDDIWSLQQSAFKSSFAPPEARQRLGERFFFRPLSDVCGGCGGENNAGDERGVAEGCEGERGG
ncbi:unnamed protein product [Vitrella brassicaformis CCMP3155]|uniref:Adenosine deaminase domain-containing protein n=1 Tax=Vitrella brassicaformis (strain CCMP3155) TaxID=1169540 RepID=A0A0G4GF01_VITBC|nr:unnamed protein product [Vitrella brassicaformis CCMP3155]|eukprot:CEM27754.1 unnamed protein product [Vitrella brassicaformis CCMP3155]